MSELEWFSLAVYEPWFLTGGILFALVAYRAYPGCAAVAQDPGAADVSRLQPPGV